MNFSALRWNVSGCDIATEFDTLCDEVFRIRLRSVMRKLYVVDTCSTWIRYRFTCTILIVKGPLHKTTATTEHLQLLTC